MTHKFPFFRRQDAQAILEQTRGAQQSSPSMGMAGPQGGAIRPVPKDDVWLGIITNVGPAAEPDYTGPQYWVQSAEITNASGSNPPNTTLPTFAAMTTGTEAAKWITATNLNEIVDGTHAIAVDSIVWVYEVYGIDQSPYYAFAAGGAGAAASTVLVDAVATSNITLSGTQTVDGIALVVGDLCLAQAQTTTADNGVYTVAAGAWTPYDPPQPDTVAVALGTTYGLSWWFLTAADTYTQFVSGASVTIAKLASTANVASLSGHPTIDGVVTADNDIVLLKNQSTASQNGTYKVLNAGWVKQGQPTMVFVTAGTIAANTMFILKAANSYQGVTGIYT